MSGWFPFSATAKYSLLGYDWTRTKKSKRLITKRCCVSSLQMCRFVVFLALGNATKVWGNFSNVNGQNSYKDNIWKTKYGFISRSLSCCPIQHDLCGHLTATHPIPPPLQERRYFWSLVFVSVRTSMFPAMMMRVVSSSSCRFARRPLS